MAGSNRAPPPSSSGPSPGSNLHHPQPNNATNESNLVGVVTIDFSYPGNQHAHHQRLHFLMDHPGQIQPALLPTTSPTSALRQSQSGTTRTATSVSNNSNNNGFRENVNTTATASASHFPMFSSAGPQSLDSLLAGERSGMNHRNTVGSRVFDAIRSAFDRLHPNSPSAAASGSPFRFGGRHSQQQHLASSELSSPSSASSSPASGGEEGLQANRRNIARMALIAGRPPIHHLPAQQQQHQQQHQHAIHMERGPSAGTGAATAARNLERHRAFTELNHARIRATARRTSVLLEQRAGARRRLQQQQRQQQQNNNTSPDGRPLTRLQRARRMGDRARRAAQDNDREVAAAQAAVVVAAAAAAPADSSSGDETTSSSSSPLFARGDAIATASVPSPSPRSCTRTNTADSGVGGGVSPLPSSPQPSSRTAPLLDLDAPVFASVQPQVEMSPTSTSRVNTPALSLPNTTPRHLTRATKRKVEQEQQIAASNSNNHVDNNVTKKPSLKRKAMESPSSSPAKHTEQCCICMTEPEASEIATINGCKHKFCFGCIETWANRENTCPLCKERFTKIDRISKQTKRGIKRKKKINPRDQRADIVNPLQALFASTAARALSGEHNLSGHLPPFLAAGVSSSLGLGRGSFVDVTAEGRVVRYSGSADHIFDQLAQQIARNIGGGGGGGGGGGSPSTIIHGGETAENALQVDDDDDTEDEGLEVVAFN